MRPLADSFDEEELPLHWRDELVLPRQRRGRWIVAGCLLVSLGVIGLAAERRYHVTGWIAKAASPRPAVDERAEALLGEGEKALAAGDLETAQGDFDKASVLAEGNARALLGEALVATAKADVPWLTMRLLPPSAVIEARTTRAQLDEQVALARRAADAAVAAAPQDPGALRVQLDALRLAGDIEGARAHVIAVFAQAAQPETAYVLAALDLAQPAMPLATAIDRLRQAATAEAVAGRASAALVYALARSGDVASAKTVLGKLDASSRPYPLLPALHALVDAGRKPVAAPSAAPALPESAAATAPVDSAAPPQAAAPQAAALPQAASPADGREGARPSTDGVTAGQGAAPRPVGHNALQLAAGAARSGDLERAERIYQAILASDPNDSQALAGLGDVLRSRNDPWGAIEAYQKAIASNPSYVPALVGLADTQWARGDRAGATKTYQTIVTRFPEGVYPAYVGARAAGATP